MRLVTSILFIGIVLWLAAACNRSVSDVSPSALDSIGVVGTFVSAKNLAFNGNPADISALAVDSVGNVYASDRRNLVIRKISPTGEVKTLAGSGLPGYENGPAATARFTERMFSLAVDKAENVYVGEDCIRKISPTGQVSTFAGTPFRFLENLSFTPSTSPDGLGTSARFILVKALAFDSAGNLFASDISSINRYISDAIRKVTPDGHVKTILGYVSGLPRQGQDIAELRYPHQFLSLAVNKANKLVGVEQGSGSVFQISPTGDAVELPISRRFQSPRIMVYDQADQLLVANTTKLWRVMSDNRIMVLAGDDKSGFRNDSLRLARFDGISAVAVDSKHLLYIADQGGQVIRRVRLN